MISPYNGLEKFQTHRIGIHIFVRDANAHPHSSDPISMIRYTFTIYTVHIAYISSDTLFHGHFEHRVRGRGRVKR